MQASEKYKNYQITKFSEISEIKCSLIELEHEPTGAQIMHLSNDDDDENLFNLSFRTWPEKSNGVAHILEHTVLCGSEKFPVRDPFFSMSRRSLNTFMNALTGPDFTCYPAASQVPKDFYNLLEVYLDAVFHPKLSKLSFLQEGHRLEFLKPDDPASPLLIKGVVFNEMKGALSSGESRLTEALMHELFPHLTYGVNSGGDPEEIPNLTYEELKAFHEKFYHPSRCLFFFYGNLPLENHLDFLEEYAFKNVKKLEPLPWLPKQPRFASKKVQTLRYPVVEKENNEDKTLVALGWLTCNILEQEELLALSVLDLVLMATDASPLKKALLKSNLCKQADSLLDSEMSEVPFMLICKGCKENAAEAIEKLVRSEIEKLIENGLAQNLIEGAIHQLEMSRTEITGNSAPYGLSLYFRSALLKQHGGDSEDGLRIHTLFNKLRQKVQDDSYLSQILRKHFIDNPHFVRLEMNPDEKLSKKEIENEKKKLAKLKSSLNEAQVAEILKQTKELAVYQESEKDENPDVLPRVFLSDVAPQGKDFFLIEESKGPFRLFCHPCFTNELVYTDLIFDLPRIEEEELPYLRLFSLFLPQMGSGKRNYQEQLEYIMEHTGGIGASLDLCIQVSNPSEMRPFLNIKAKALSRKVDRLFPLLKDIVQSCDFKDVSRLRELLKQHFLGLENSIHHSSLKYAVNLAASGHSLSSKISNRWYGLDYFWALKKIVEEFEKSPSSLIEKLEEMQKKCLRLENPHLVLSCDENIYQKIKSENLYGLLELEFKKFEPWKNIYTVEKNVSQARLIAAPVAFTAMLFSSVSYTHPDASSLSLAAQIMENKTLHMRIREQGGRLWLRCCE